MLERAFELIFGPLFIVGFPAAIFAALALIGAI